MKETIIKASEALFKIDGQKLFERTREQPYANIRQLIYTYLHSEMDWNHKQIGDFFNRDRSTVTVHLQKFKKTMEIYKEERLNYGRFTAMVSDRGSFDKELLEEFLEVNDKFLSDDLKRYLKVRL